MERITITLTRDGKLRGASAQDWDGMPVPLDAKQLNEIAADINVAALNAVADLESTTATATTAQAEAEQAKQAAESERDNLAAQLEEANSKIAELTAPPTEITIKAWQAVAILRHMNLWDSVLAIVAALPDGPDKITIETAIEKNADFARHGKTILMLAPALGLTDEQLDAMFSAGAALAV